MPNIPSATSDPVNFQAHQRIQTGSWRTQGMIAPQHKRITPNASNFAQSLTMAKPATPVVQPSTTIPVTFFGAPKNTTNSVIDKVKDAVASVVDLVI